MSESETRLTAPSTPSGGDRAPDRGDCVRIGAGRVDDDRLDPGEVVGEHRPDRSPSGRPVAVDADQHVRDEVQRGRVAAGPRAPSATRSRAQRV